MSVNRVVVAALSVAILSAAACGGRAGDVAEYKDTVALPAEPLLRQVPAAGRHGGRFILGQTVNPKTFNDMMATEQSSSDITLQITAYLVRFDLAKQEFEPEVAKSWEVAPDGVTWTLHLRRGAAFSDGHPITAEDVLFSLEVAYDKTLHPAVQDLLKIGGEHFTVSALDPYTVVINTLKTNADNVMRVAVANFIKDDLAKVGVRVVLAPVDFNTLITNIRSDFQYDAVLLGLQSGVPPSPANGQNVWRSSGETHFWFPRQQKPDTPEEARIDRLMDELLTNQDRASQKRAWKDIQTIMNEQSWFIWLPILQAKLPISNRFGNVQPSSMSHRIIWNAERIYVKPRES